MSDHNLPNHPISMDLLYDPDEHLSDEKFREYFPNSGDLPISSFSDDDLAYQYAEVHGLCVYDDDSMQCIFCRRADH